LVFFGNETFNQAEVLKKSDKHIKIVRDQYRTHIEKNARYEHPPMIPTMEWKALVDDGGERTLRKERKLALGT
jgi:hypothetical protein